MRMHNERMQTCEIATESNCCVVHCAARVIHHNFRLFSSLYYAIHRAIGLVREMQRRFPEIDAALGQEVERRRLRRRRKKLLLRVEPQPGRAHRQHGRRDDCQKIHTKIKDTSVLREEGEDVARGDYRVLVSSSLPDSLLSTSFAAPHAATTGMQDIGERKGEFLF